MNVRNQYFLFYPPLYLYFAVVVNGLDPGRGLEVGDRGLHGGPAQARERLGRLDPAYVSQHPGHRLLE